MKCRAFPDDKASFGIMSSIGFSQPKTIPDSSYIQGWEIVGLTEIHFDFHLANMLLKIKAVLLGYAIVGRSLYYSINHISGLALSEILTVYH